MTYYSYLIRKSVKFILRQITQYIIHTILIQFYIHSLVRYSLKFKYLWKPCLLTRSLSDAITNYIQWTLIFCSDMRYYCFGDTIWPIDGTKQTAIHPKVSRWMGSRCKWLHADMEKNVDCLQLWWAWIARGTWRLQVGLP